MIDIKIGIGVFSGILAAIAAYVRCEKLNKQQRNEDTKNGKLMKHTYSQITVDWVSVKGAGALALCFDYLQSIGLAAPFTRMQKTPSTDP
jgi:hypothetical protein